MSRKPKIVKMIGLFLILFLVIVGTGLLTFNLIKKDSTTKENKKNINKSKLDNTINVLLLGSDSLKEGQDRADTLMVASFDLTTKQVGIISLPRDTRVKLSETRGYHKLNAAYAYGGTKLTTNVVQKLLKVPIDYYIKVDYQGFIELINTLGGVEIEIEKDLKYVDHAADLVIDLEKGRHKLTGSEALNYVRFRHDALGDIGRIKRQQKLLKEVIAQVLEPQTVFKVPELIRKLNKFVDSNLKLKQMLQLASLVTDFKLEHVAMETLPGTPKYIDGISYWLPDKKKIEGLVVSLISNKSYFRHQNLKLIILNGSGQSGLARNYAQQLTNQGYQVNKIANADNFNYSKNIIISPVEQADDLDDLINYLNGELIVKDEASEIKVIIGQDINSRR